ncbi:MAG: NTP transferase domain-containing protein [Sulfolobales archaeon]
MIREAIVLAAGWGKRFKSCEHKLLAKILGYHLIEYPIRSIASAGLRRILIVTNGLLLKKLERIVREVEKDVGVEVDLVLNNEVSRGNAYSLALGLSLIREELALVTVADHIYPLTLVERLLKGYSGVSLGVGGDREPKHVEISEATLVEIGADGAIEDIGKNLKSWSYVDTGLHIASTDLLKYTGCCRYEGELASLYKCFSRATRRSAVIDVTGSPWKDIDTWDDYISVAQGKDRVVAAFAIESWRK